MEEPGEQGERGNKGVCPRPRQLGQDARGLHRRGGRHLPHAARSCSPHRAARKPDSKRPRSIGFHLQGMSRSGKSRDRKYTGGPRGWGEGVMANGPGVYFRGEENVLG